MAYHAAAAGVAAAKPFGYNPSAPSGYFQRHLDATLPYLQDRDKLNSVDIPAFVNEELGRSTHTLQVLLPHEALSEAYQEDAALRVRLREMRAARDFPPCYYQHPLVVADNDRLIAPVSLFVDGVPYSNTDTVIGFWAINEVSGSRHLLAIVRKALLCDCGCRGWCSLNSVFQVFAWSFKCMARGQYPAQRHDSTDFEGGSWRQGVAGSTLGVFGCLLYIKGDWAEFCSTFGFPTWRDGLRPCFKCIACPDNMYNVVGITPIALPWACNAASDYGDACKRCEIIIILDRTLHREICNALFYDARDDGARGRALRKSFPQVGLKEGYRLEPSVWLPDVALFEAIEHFPWPALFWRRDAETLCRHRNPMFDTDTLGKSPNRSLTIDAQRAIYLGVMNAFCKKIVWLLINDGFWGRRDTIEELVHVAALLIRGELRAFYTTRHASNPQEGLTRIFGSMKKKIGTHAIPKLALKAAETWGFLKYLIQRMGEDLEVVKNLGHFKMYLACKALEELVTTWNESDINMNDAQIQRSYDCWNRFALYSKDMEGVDIPKKHLVTHLLDEISFFWEPKRYANWIDESLNRELKYGLRLVSQAPFESFALLRFRAFLKGGGLKRKA